MSAEQGATNATAPPGPDLNDRLPPTYQHAIERKDDGPDGWFFRTALIAPF